MVLVFVVLVLVVLVLVVLWMLSVLSFSTAVVVKQDAEKSA